MTAPCELSRLLVDLGLAGVELSRHPDDPARLRCKPATVPLGLIDGLRSHRGPILALLGGSFNPTDLEAEYTYRERLGVADGLGMPDHPGAPAWCVAVGEAMAVSGTGSAVKIPDVTS